MAQRIEQDTKLPEARRPRALEELVYAEEGTILLVYETVELAERVFKSGGPERLAFQLWFVFSYPELVEPSFYERLVALNDVGIDQTDRPLWAEYIRIKRREGHRR